MAKHKKQYKKEKVVKIPHEMLWPREIAAGYRNGKTIEWVVEQCKKFANPEAAYAWVKSYIN